MVPQFPQRASVTVTFRERPVANSEMPPVRTAPVAFPPLNPLFTFTVFRVTLPAIWQCGQTIWAVPLAFGRSFAT